MSKENTKVAGEVYISQPVTAVQQSIRRWVDTNLGTSVQLILLLLLVGIVVAGIFFAIVSMNMRTSDELSFQFTGFMIAALAAVMILICLPFTIAADYSFVTAQNLRKIGVKEALQRGYKRFGVGLGTYLLSGLFIIAGLILLIIPGIYIALRLSYINSVVANENLGVIDNIRRSFALTKGNLWDIIGAVSVGMIAGTIVSLLTTIVGSVPVLVLLLTLVSVVVSVLTTQVFYYRYHQSALEKESKLTRENTDQLNYILFAITVVVYIATAGFSGDSAFPAIPNNIYQS